jgi:hypothetical protein
MTTSTVQSGGARRRRSEAQVRKRRSKKAQAKRRKASSLEKRARKLRTGANKLLRRNKRK